MDVAVPQGAAFEHAKLIEQEVRVVAAAVEMPVPGRAFLIAMGGADRAVHVQHDVLQPVAIMEAVDPLAVQIGQRGPVLGQGQRLGLEPPHLRGRGCPRINSAPAHNLAHDWIKGETVSVIHILVARQSPIDRLPEQPVEPVDGVLAPSAVTQRTQRKVGQPKRTVQLAHHKQTAIRTELRAPELQPYPAVEIHSISPLRTRTLWVIHETRPSHPSTP